jgi:Uma2 family endonuclease
VTGEAGGYTVGDERYIPDVAFISKTRQPEPCRLAYNPLPPDLAVEVLSPTDDPRYVRVKIGNYLGAGVVVWVVDPDTKTVEIYTPGQPVQRLTISGVLEGGAVLPGFRMPVSEMFPD